MENSCPVDITEVGQGIAKSPAFLKSSAQRSDFFIFLREMSIMRRIVIIVIVILRLRLFINFYTWFEYHLCEIIWSWFGLLSRLLVLLDRRRLPSLIMSCRFCAIGVALSVLYRTGLTSVERGGRGGCCCSDSYDSGQSTWLSWASRSLLNATNAVRLSVESREASFIGLWRVSFRRLVVLRNWVGGFLEQRNS